MLLVACLSLFVVAGAQAVHNTGLFQLDGDAQKATVSYGPGPLSAEDWDSVCAKYPPPAGTPNNTPGPWCFKAPGVTLPAPTTADRSVFITDGFDQTSDNIYKGGTDDGSINPAVDGVGGTPWLWKQAKPSPPKADIEQAFAAQYTCSASCANPSYANHKLIFFGGTRLANNGDTNIGLWFLHNKVTPGGSSATQNPDGSFSCPVTSGCGFTGSHTVGNCSLPNHPNPCTPGDLFVQSAFTSKPTISIFEWVGPGKATAPCITIACDLQPVSFATGPDGTNKCEKSGTVNDQGCAVVNDVATVGGTGEIQSPWLFQDAGSQSPPNKIEAAELFEGGLDLTGLGFGDECISTILLNTRSSGSSVNSTAQDFAMGSFGSCTSSVKTTPSITSDTEIPASGTISNVTDTAAVDVQGISSWTGTVTFSLCGPADLTSQTNCKTGGTAIAGGTATDSSKNVTSAAATITSVGKYCWRANVHFTKPASGVPDAVDPDPNGPNPDSQSECFNITPKQPTLSTQASGPVSLGNAISDTATIKNTANQPGSPVINPTTAGVKAGGDITWTAYGPNDCTTVAFGPVTRTITGDGTYPSAAQAAVSFTPTKEGVYTFVASYGGNSPNTKSVGASACPDTTGTETVTVSSASVKTTPSVNGSTSITTAGSIQVTDSATVTVTGATTWSGTVQFHLCGPADLVSAANCNTGGTLIGSDKGVSNSGATNQSDAATITSAGNYCWRGDFTSSTTGVPNASDPSDTTSTTECFTVTPVTPQLNTQVGNGIVTLGNPITDTATIGGTAFQPGTPVINPTTAGVKAGGDITWNVYGPDSCTTLAAGPFTRTITGDGTYPTGAQNAVSFTPTAIGVYVFVASYGGNSPNTNGVPAIDCASQPSTEMVSVIGNAHASSEQNWLPNDTVKLTGDANLNGDLQITLYPGGSCSAGGTVQPAIPTFDITVTNGDKNGASYSTNNTQFTVKTTPTSTWSWLVHYKDSIQTSPADSCTEVTTLNITN
jgi:hypothetical protein